LTLDKDAFLVGAISVFVVLIVWRLCEIARRLRKAERELEEMWKRTPKPPPW
jgi:hypothetical protein